MQIETSTHGDLLEVSPKGRLDSNTSPELEKALLEQIGNGQSKITVNFGGIDYVSSAGLRVLLVAAKRTAATKGQFSMHSMSPEIREVFEISGFLTILKVYPDLNAVIAAG